VTGKKDYYEVLGVPRTATEKDLKAAYRALARKHHPDVNPGDKKAEEKFKELSEAFAVLSDPEKRAKYDRGGHDAFEPGFDPFQGGSVDFSEFGFGNLADIFEMFGGARGAHGARGRATRRAAGEDIDLEMSLPFAQAIQGTTIEVGIPRGVWRGKNLVRHTESMKVRIPAGIDDGERVRIAGKGNDGPGGGPAGDAFVHIRVEPHPMFRREGTDLVTEVPVGMVKAALGGEVLVPTLDGSATIKVPAGTRGGQRFRLKGRGVPARTGRAAGDLHVIVQIVTPKDLDAKSRELLEEFAKLNPNS
jgi:DnaJ-class molecular chaperone